MSFDLSPFDFSLFDNAGSSQGSDKFANITVPRWFSSAINQEPGTNVFKLMQIIRLRAAELATMYKDLIASRQISKATGAALDAIADGYNVTRNDGESDEAFRARIPTTILIQSSSGTVPEIQSAVAYLLDMQPQEIGVVERYSTSPYAIFTVRLLGKPGKLYDWANVDAMVMGIKPAGVAYESADYDITEYWVNGGTGFGYDSWGEQYPSQ